MLQSMERKEKKSKSKMMIHMVKRKATLALEDLMTTVVTVVTVALAEIQMIPTEAKTVVVMTMMTASITVICLSMDLPGSQSENLSREVKRTASINLMIRLFYLFIISVALTNITLD